jgi:ribosomal protein L29
MKFKEIAQLNIEELEQKQKELELELIKLNAQVATGTPPKNAGQLRRIKKDIAKIMLLKSRKDAASLAKQAVVKQPAKGTKKVSASAPVPEAKTAKKTNEKTK